MDSRFLDAIREVKPLLKSGMKFRAQNEIDESVAVLMFEEVRGPIQSAVGPSKMVPSDLISQSRFD